MRRLDKINSQNILLLTCLLLFCFVIISIICHYVFTKRYKSQEGWTELTSTSNTESLFNLAPSDFEVYLINLDRNPEMIFKYPWKALR